MTSGCYDVYKKKYDKETKTLYGGKMTEQICQALAGELCKEAIDRSEELGLECVSRTGPRRGRGH